MGVDDVHFLVPRHPAQPHDRMEMADALDLKPVQDWRDAAQWTRSGEDDDGQCPVEIKHREALLASTVRMGPGRTTRGRSRSLASCSSYALGRCRLAITSDIETRASRGGVLLLIESRCPGMCDDQLSHVHPPLSCRSKEEAEVLRIVQV